MARPKTWRNISRIEQASSSGHLLCGWEVRIQRRGKKYEKYFGDSAFGGKRAALNAAKQYRDRLLQELRDYTIKELARVPSARNTSGIVGVRPATRTEVFGDYEYTYEFWIAQWTDAEGVRRTRSFSCSKYGDEKALQMAINARNRGVAQAQKNK